MDFQLYSDYQPISTSEAYYLLLSKKNESHHANNTTNDAFLKTFEYCERFLRIENLSLLEDLKIFMNGLGFNESEIAILSSIFPQTVSEAKTLLPSTVRFEDSVIQAVLNRLHEIEMK